MATHTLQGNKRRIKEIFAPIKLPTMKTIDKLLLQTLELKVKVHVNPIRHSFQDEDITRQEVVLYI